MTFLPNKTPKLAIIACLLIVYVVEIEINQRLVRLNLSAMV
jgi:hypothetical protein